MSGDFTVLVPLPLPTCPECGAVARNVTPFISGELVCYVYRCLNGHRYEQAATNVQGAVETQQERADLVPLHGNFGVHCKWGPLQIFDESGKERRFTAEPCGPLEMLVMSLARELHDAEHADCDWFGHVGSTISSFCRRACEARGLDWKWVLQAIERERLDERTEAR